MRKYTDEQLREHHRACSRNYHRRRQEAEGAKKWKEALDYLLSLQGELPDLAKEMAKKYSINKKRY